MNFYLDFEATQFGNKIISIGCTNEKGAKFTTLVKPPKGYKVTSFITELTGITKEMVKDAPSADEAFSMFYDWALANCDGSMPQYFCYGDCDIEFIASTVKDMSNFKAICFAMSIKAMLIDYSVVVKEYLCTQQVALKKVVALIEGHEIEQKHDALEDAEMLRKVVENLQYKCTPTDAAKLATMKSTPKPKPKGAPKIYLSWNNQKRFHANTQANKSNYIIKCWQENKFKYFNSINTAALWCIKYLVQGKSPRHENDVIEVENYIKEAITMKQEYCDLWWEEK